MNSRKILTVIIFTLLIFQLSGCKNSISNEANKSENSRINSESNLEDNEQENNNINIIYDSKLGFSIEFPAQWKDKYIIKEDEKILYVYFNSKDANQNTYRENSGLFFCVMKKDSMIDRDHYEPITDKEYITLNNTKYFVGSSTELSYNPNNKDFRTFLSMNNEREQVINTMKILQ